MAREKRDWDALIKQTQRNPNMGPRDKQRRIQEYRREMTFERQRAEAGGQAEKRPRPKKRPRSSTTDRKPKRRTSTWGIDETMKKLGIY